MSVPAPPVFMEASARTMSTNTAVHVLSATPETDVKMVTQHLLFDGYVLCNATLIINGKQLHSKEVMSN